MGFLVQPVTLNSLFLKRRTIDGITVNVVLREVTTDNLTVTKQPVQQGASITDHSYKEPTILGMDAYFEANIGNSLKQIYQQLLDLQNKRAPFTVTTPKRTYSNMLLTGLRLNTDRLTENVLSLGMTFQEVILVQVSVLTVDRNNLKHPGKNGATVPAGRKQPQQSFLSSIGGSAATLFKGGGG